MEKQKTMAKVTIGESGIKQIISSTINEFFDRETMDSMQALGIKDPSSDYTINQGELKEKCGAFIQKCNEFETIIREFYAYIDGVEEDAENGVEGSLGARGIMRRRNMFGARNIQDEILEEDLDELEKALWRLKSALEDAVEGTEALA